MNGDILPFPGLRKIAKELLVRFCKHQGGADIETVADSAMSGYQSGNFGGDLWIQIFSCCINQPPQQKRRHRRIERSMIGEPTNFQHTGHIGSGDLELVNSQLRVVQKQMQSKGGYEVNLSSSTKAF